jgi:hypothetical protein
MAEMRVQTGVTVSGYGLTASFLEYGNEIQDSIKEDISLTN